MAFEYATLTNLREYAKEQGIKNQSRKTEDELIEELMEFELEVSKKSDKELTVDDKDEISAEKNEDIDEKILKLNKELEDVRNKEKELVKEVCGLSKERIAMRQKSNQELIKEAQIDIMTSPAVKRAQEMAHLKRIAVRKQQNRK